MDVAAVCKVGVVPVGRVGVVSASVQKRWPSAVSVRVDVHRSNILRRMSRCNVASESVSDSLPSKDYIPHEVMHEGSNHPESETSATVPSFEIESALPSPPPATTSAASSSIGEGIGVSEHSTLSMSSGASSNNRDWRVFSSGSQLSQGSHLSETGLNVVVEKPNTSHTLTQQKQQMYGPSEASCDEGSSFLKMERILETDGGKSADDYKLRAHIFSESAAFFTALKNRNSAKRSHGTMN